MRAIPALIVVALAGFELRADDDFEKTVRPILVERCVKCHGPAKQSGGLRLDSRDAILKGGDTGPAAVDKKPEESLLFKAVAHAGELKMPPKEKLADKEIAALRGWIERGLPWPKTSGGATVAGTLAEAHRNWWAFRPVRPVSVPRIEAPSDIDRFILAGLKAKGLTPSAPADRRTLIRRVSFDLIGLPPTPEEVDSFVADRRPDAYERVVDRLLASPRHGERMARHWLDAVRYADYHDGNPKARNPVCEPLEAWRYRDWVVRAFNSDLPFDRFIVHQIAGDLLPPPDGKQPYADGLIATTFLVNGAWDRGDADKEKMVGDMVDDQIDTVGKAFLGLTLGCARCHDHKFDPVSQADYTALAGIFHSTRMLTELGTKGGEITLQRRALAPKETVEKRNRQLKQIAGLTAILAEMDKKNPKVPADDPTRELLVEQRNAIQKELLPEPPLALAVSEGGVPGGLFPGIQDVPLHIRGSYTRLGPVVPRGMPKFFAGDRQPKIEGSGRMALANWIASANHPLTARVVVNRVWQWHFGRGLVTTPNNFGLLSERPSHPELLDWLAAKFVEEGWSPKALHRRIVLTAAYRQASTASSDAIVRDPENKWLGRFVPRRLEAEALRDAMLFVAGRLDPASGGPATHDLATTRRSLYVQTARWDRGNFATLFDAANPDASVEKRDVSTVAPQALFLMNHEFVRTQAKHLADRAARDEPMDGTARMRRMFRLAFQRSATAEELAAMGKLPAGPDAAHVLLCGNEFAYID